MRAHSDLGRGRLIPHVPGPAIDENQDLRVVVVVGHVTAGSKERARTEGTKKEGAFSWRGSFFPSQELRFRRVEPRFYCRSMLRSSRYQPGLAAARSVETVVLSA